MSRPRGRPPLDPSGRQSADVHLTLPAREYDDVSKLATKRRETVQEVIRRGLQRLLKEEHRF